MDNEIKLGYGRFLDLTNGDMNINRVEFVDELVFPAPRIVKRDDGFEDIVYLESNSDPDSE